jgi:hypothetical protein
MKHQCLDDARCGLPGYVIVHSGLLPLRWMHYALTKLVKSTTPLCVALIINYYNFNSIMSSLRLDLLH